MGTVSSKTVICSKNPGQSDTGSGKSEGDLSRLKAKKNAKKELSKDDCCCLATSLVQ